MCIFKAPTINAPAPQPIIPPDVKPIEEPVAPKLGADEPGRNTKALGKNQLKIKKDRPDSGASSTGSNRGGMTFNNKTKKGGK